MENTFGVSGVLLHTASSNESTDYPSTECLKLRVHVYNAHPEKSELSLVVPSL